MTRITLTVHFMRVIRVIRGFVRAVRFKKVRQKREGFAPRSRLASSFFYVHISFEVTGIEERLVFRKLALWDEL
jgi:hypothetical protein